MIMKRINYILSFAAALSLAACDVTVIDGPLPSDIAENNSISVVKGNVVFSPDGGAGYVVVKTEGNVTARSTREWVSVECFGDSVAVNCQSHYEDLASRYAQVVVYNTKDSVVLNVHQAGAINLGFDDSGVFTNHEEGMGEITFNSNMLPRVESSVKWVTTEVMKNRILVYFQKNESEEYRDGVLTCKLGPTTYKVPVGQLEARDILGVRNWNITGTLMDGSTLALKGVISKSGLNYTMAITGTNINWSMPATVTGNQLNIPLGTSIGRYSADGRNYYVIPAVGEGTNTGSTQTLSVTGNAGFAMSRNPETDKWVGSVNLKPFAELYGEPVFRFEYWLNSTKTGVSSGGFRFRELTIQQQ